MIRTIIYLTLWGIWILMYFVSDTMKELRYLIIWWGFLILASLSICLWYLQDISSLLLIDTYKECIDLLK